MKGGALLLAANFFIVLQSALAKLFVEGGVSPVEALFYRNFGCFILVASVMLAMGRRADFKTARPMAHFRRAFIGNLCIGLVFWAQSILPLATVSAIMLTSAIFATALAPIFLKERISWVRGSCVVIGFIGAFVIVNPSGWYNGVLEVEGLAYGIALTAAVASAFVGIALRDLGKSESAWTTSFYFLGYGALGTGILMPFVWTGWPSAYELIAGMVVLGMVNQLLKTQAFRFAEVSFLSPLNYFSVIWSTLLGWAIWSEVPSAHVYIGCGIVILSNLAIAWRQRQLVSA